MRLYLLVGFAQVLEVSVTVDGFIIYWSFICTLWCTLNFITICILPVKTIDSIIICAPSMAFICIVLVLVIIVRLIIHVSFLFLWLYGRLGEKRFILTDMYIEYHGSIFSVHKDMHRSNIPYHECIMSKVILALNKCHHSS